MPNPELRNNLRQHGAQVKAKFRHLDEIGVGLVLGQGQFVSLPKLYSLVGTGDGCKDAKNEGADFRLPDLSFWLELY
jgi:hypothetical protein